MKKLIFCTLIALVLLVLSVCHSHGQAPMVWTTIYATNANISWPTNFTAGLGVPSTNIYAQRVTVLGKVGPRTTNTAVVYIGTSATSTNNPYPVAPGGEMNIIAPENSKFNLKDLYFDVISANDGITIIYK